MSATVAIIGNPNSGKTTIFNGLTGSRQRIGNWPGVTVERKEGSFSPGVAERTTIRIVDLPGIYSLSASSQDEAIARDYLLSGEPDLVVNVVDASNIERNLFLTLGLIEMRVPVLVVLNMIDVAEKEGITIDVEHLAAHLGCPVVAASGIRTHDIASVKDAIADAVSEAQASRLQVTYPPALEDAVASLVPKTATLSSLLGADARWTALSLLDGDPWIRRQFLQTSTQSADDLDASIRSTRELLGEEIDVAIADAKYGVIHGLSRHVTRTALTRASLTERVDRVVLNRLIALPIFFGVMYLVFWFTMFVGGAFIDFFDVLFGTVFVDGLGAGLAALGSPEWLVSLVAGGIGTGVQTVATFVPIIFAMFIALSVLEDSGYMARAAYVMDRFMRSIGLPGRSFVPMMVGFGCTVPAIMATRTLDSTRERFMTSFMSPFMSCGARLPVYALFAAAFFASNAGLVVFSLYAIGIAVAILTGLLLKHTLFRGEVSHFVMELPPYHAPRLRFVLGQAWHRLRAFVKRAGITITIIVTVLAFLNSIGTDGSFGNEDQSDSVLSGLGRAITPVFAPMGIEQDNWPATVGLFTGIFAKEVVVGTLSSLYAQDAPPSASPVSSPEASSATSPEAPAPVPGRRGDEAFSLLDGVREAFATIPEAFGGAFEGLADPLGTGLVGQDEDSVGEEVGAGPVVFQRMRSQFTPQAAYAYLLFVLLYIPCVAAMGAAIREMGAGLGWLLAAYTGIVAWSIATLFYQLSTGPAFFPIALAIGLLALLAALLWVLGRTVYRPAVLAGDA